MPLVIVAGGVALLLLLMIRFKLNGFISLVLVALAVGIAQGMPVDKVIGSIKAGVGGTLGSLALIMGFGAMLGKLLADCGGAQLHRHHADRQVRQKTHSMGGGADRLHRRLRAVLRSGLRAAAAAGVHHRRFRAHPAAVRRRADGRRAVGDPRLPAAAPGPTAIATIFHADMGKTLLYGTLLAIPTVILAGPVYARFLKGIDKPVPEGLYNPKTFTERRCRALASASPRRWCR